MPPQETVLVTEAPVFWLKKFFFVSESHTPENMITETYNYCTPRSVENNSIFIILK